MPALVRAKERAVMAQLLIGLIKTVVAPALRTPSVGLGSRVEALLISGSVLLGDVAGKPRTAGEVSRHLGIPRATVIRKLDALVRQGVCVKHRDGRRYCMSRQPHTSYNYVDEAVRLIRHSARVLGDEHT